MSDAQARQRPNWARLGDELRRLRRRAGLGQDEIAAAIGVSPTSVERYETGGAHGGAPPNLARVRSWAAACRVTGRQLATLEALADAALDERRPYRTWGTLADIQEDVRRDEASVRTLRHFNNWIIPAILQTAEYAHGALVLSDVRHLGGIEAAVAQRLARQVILGEEGRQFEFLLTEAALQFRPDGLSMSAWRAQLAYLSEVVRRPAIKFGVIPSQAEAHANRMCSFVLYENPVDDGTPFAAIELPHERIEARTPADFKVYEESFALLRQDAIAGDEAVTFVREVGNR